jgi:hypothetical protein
MDGTISNLIPTEESCVMRLSGQKGNEGHNNNWLVSTGVQTMDNGLKGKKIEFYNINFLVNDLYYSWIITSTLTFSWWYEVIAIF